jgi:RNA-splicing ligase RtcB
MLTEGRGCEYALCSSAHGAGPVLSRTAARRQVTERALRQQMEGIWYDSPKTDGLRDEAPSAYKEQGTVSLDRGCHYTTFYRR